MLPFTLSLLLPLACSFFVFVHLCIFCICTYLYLQQLVSTGLLIPHNWMFITEVTIIFSMTRMWTRNRSGCVVVLPSLPDLPLLPAKAPQTIVFQTKEDFSPFLPPHHSPFTDRGYKHHWKIYTTCRWCFSWKKAWLANIYAWETWGLQVALWCALFQ